MLNVCARRNSAFRIRPLDIPAALQILELKRASFELQAILMGDTGAAGIESPNQAARALLQMVLQALPVESNALARTQRRRAATDALQTVSSLRHAGAVSAYVPASVVVAAEQARTLVRILGDDPRNPIWLRPEWAGLAPRFERFWRRRRIVRRQLTDPDYSGSFDDNEPRP